MGCFNMFMAKYYSTKTGKDYDEINFVNSLPDRLRDPKLSSDSFRKLLKTELIASY